MPLKSQNDAQKIQRLLYRSLQEGSLALGTPHCEKHVEVLRRLPDGRETKAAVGLGRIATEEGVLFDNVEEIER